LKILLIVNIFKIKIFYSYKSSTIWIGNEKKLSNVQKQKTEW